MKYEIVKVRLDGIPKIPYADGIGKHRGVCAHSTANYGSGEEEDLAMNERNWEQKHWNDAWVHYFCDYNTVLDVADDDYISYGCSGGNPYFINIELCQTKRADRFIESYNRWIFIMAKVLFDNKLGVIDGVTLVSHRWVSKHYGGTHDDPHAYIESHGKTWADVVRDVTNTYAELEVEVTVPLDKNCAKYIEAVLSYYWTLMDGNKGMQDYTHYVANEFRRANGLPLQ